MPALLDMRRGHGQDVAVPLAGGKTHPSVSGVIGRMRTPVHPNRAVLFVGAGVLPDRDQVLSFRIALFPDAQLKRAAVNIGRCMHLTLVLLQTQTIGIPAQSPLSRRSV